MQYFKPENYFEVRRALQQAGRSDLIGGGCDCLIPDRPPKEAIEKRRQKANSQLEDGKYVHTIPNGKTKKKGKQKQSRHEPGPGYRPDTRKARNKP